MPHPPVSTFRRLAMAVALALLAAPAAARFGYDAGDPIRTVDVAGEYAYLARLRGPDGAAVSASRYGSTFVEGFDSPMDIWELSCGTNSVDVYVYGYGPTNSLAAPEGFSLAPLPARDAGETAAAVADEPDRDPVLLNERAWTLYLAGRAEEALPLARKAVERSDWRTFPLNVAARDTLACALCALGRPDEAKDALAEAFKALLSGRFMVARNGDPDETGGVDRIMQFHLAQIYDRAGETDLARATLQVVVRAGFLPDAPEEERAFAALVEKLGLATPPPAAPAP